MALVLLHTFWGIVFFDACERRRYWGLGLVVTSHLLTSGLVSAPPAPPHAASASGSMEGGALNGQFLLGNHRAGLESLKGLDLCPPPIPIPNASLSIPRHS